MYTYTHICIIYVWIHMHIYIWIRLCTYTYVYIYAYTCMCIFLICTHAPRALWREIALTQWSCSGHNLFKQINDTAHSLFVSLPSDTVAELLTGQDNTGNTNTKSGQDHCFMRTTCIVDMREKLNKHGRTGTHRVIPDDSSECSAPETGRWKFCLVYTFKHSISNTWTREK